MFNVIIVVMEGFVIVKTYTYAYELAAPRALLESEGIETIVKDELTTLVNPFLSNAIGGVKLMVHTSEVDRALELLGQPLSPDLDLLKREEDFWKKVDHRTRNIPLVKSMEPATRLIFIASLLLVIIMLCVMYMLV